LVKAPFFPVICQLVYHAFEPFLAKISQSFLDGKMPGFTYGIWLNCDHSPFGQFGVFGDSYPKSQVPVNSSDFAT
jgi:hypothetical protein